MGWILGHIKIIAIGAAIVALISIITTGIIYVHGAEKAKGLNIVLEDRVQRTEQMARKNQTAVEQCLAANEANALEALAQKDRARDAELRLIAAETNAQRDIDDINREAENFRSRDMACPALDRSFRAWLLNDA